MKIVDLVGLIGRHRGSQRDREGREKTLSLLVVKRQHIRAKGPGPSPVGATAASSTVATPWLLPPLGSSTDAFFHDSQLHLFLRQPIPPPLYCFVGDYGLSRSLRPLTASKVVASIAIFFVAGKGFIVHSSPFLWLGVMLSTVRFDLPPLSNQRRV
ncbi:hypothetical protein GW17_00023593 [Ensete ventricosum]|nr:hypothetical protein GW17_00023593 [Ensete ventricosum]